MSASLAGVYALRMFGLFLVLPVLAEHARHLPGGDDPRLVGLALGAYGLTQAALQIPFGIASDRWGRKPVIFAGLVVFALGSLLAAMADSVPTMIVGRAVQGAGAISAAVSALLADHTRDHQRTKAMAMVGASIGVSFAVSLVAAPWLYGLIGMGGLFMMTGVLALAAIGVIRFAVPSSPPGRAPMPGRLAFRRVLSDPDLHRLNLGIFSLHAVQTAMFVVIPGWLVSRGQLPLAEHWKLYLPVVLVSFVLMLPPIAWAERRGRLKPVFLSAIVLVAMTQFGLMLRPDGLALVTGLLLAFFAGFNILEASLPSIVSRLAPAEAKGAALGVYNTAQSIGLFTGGAAGGVLLRLGGASAVFVGCGALLLVWLIVASRHRRWPSPRGPRPSSGASGASA